MDSYIDGQIDRQMDRQIYNSVQDKQMDKQTHYIHVDIVNVVRLTNIDPGLLNIILTGKKNCEEKANQNLTHE